MNMNQKNKKTSDVQTQNKVINANASQNKQVQGYVKTKVEQAKKELKKIENEITELEQN
jgi:hypothetical protein